MKGLGVPFGYHVRELATLTLTLTMILTLTLTLTLTPRCASWRATT